MLLEVCLRFTATAALSINPGSAIALAARAGLGRALSAATKALPVPPCHRGGPVEQSPGVTSHLPRATAEGERSRLLKCRGTTHCGQGKGSPGNRAGNVDWAAAAVINSAGVLMREREE